MKSLKSNPSRLKFYADVYVWFPDGRIQKVSPGDGIYYQPCIHPEGTHVVFSGNSSGAPRVWKVDFKTYKLLPLTALKSGARHPVFSWDGKRIIFSSDRSSDKDAECVEDMDDNGLPPSDHILNLFIMDSDGKNVKQITTGSFQDQRPCISPDNRNVAFVSNRGNFFPSLWVVPTDGSSKPRPLLKKGGGYRPWYSVDGKSIFFFTIIGKRHQICRIPANGGELIPLANDDIGRSHGPFADPNGECLLMHSTRGGKYGIWELPLNGDPPHALHPPGIESATHPTRSKNGIITFDVVRSV